MVKITLLICSAAMLAGLAMPTRNAAAQPAGTADDLKTLVEGYIGAEGKYTKKTTIGLNSASKAEMAACFHASLSDAKRTTYYAPNKLLLAAEDGSIPKGSGSYYFDNSDSKVHRAGALEGSTEANMWSNLDAGYVAYSDTVTKLEDKFVTLNTFAAEGYFNSWGYNSDTKVYYYNLTTDDKVKDGEGKYACAMWNQFLAFCAPMLYEKSGYYFSAKSLSIEEKYDTEARQYLKLSMWLESSDSGKLDTSYLAEARIYKGNIIFKEDFTKSYFLMKGSTNLGKLTQTDPSKKQLAILDVSLSKDDAVKIWSTDDQWYGASRSYEHNLTVGISKNTKIIDNSDNYVACETATYDFYAKFNDSWEYTGVWVNDDAARTVYCEANWSDIDGSTLDAHYWGSNVIGSEWDYKPRMIYDHKNGSDQNVYRVVIPGATTSIKFRYNKTSGAGGAEVQCENQTLGTDNSYYWDNWNDGTPKMKTYNYSPAA